MILLRRYLTGFGPARVTDAANWAGLAESDVQQAADGLRLRRFRDEEGRALVDLPRPRSPAASPGHRPVSCRPGTRRSSFMRAEQQILPERFRPLVFDTKTPHSTPTFLVDGAVAGKWSCRGDQEEGDTPPRAFRAHAAPSSASCVRRRSALVRFVEPDATIAHSARKMTTPPRSRALDRALLAEVAAFEPGGRAKPPAPRSPQREWPSRPTGHLTQRVLPQGVVVRKERPPGLEDVDSLGEAVEHPGRDRQPCRDGNRPRPPLPDCPCGERHRPEEQGDSPTLTEAETSLANEISRSTASDPSATVASRTSVSAVTSTASARDAAGRSRVDARMGQDEVEGAPLLFARDGSRSRADREDQEQQRGHQGVHLAVEVADRAREIELTSGEQRPDRFRQILGVIAERLVVADRRIERDVEGDQRGDAQRPPEQRGRRRSRSAERDLNRHVRPRSTRGRARPARAPRS